MKLYLLLLLPIMINVAFADEITIENREMRKSGDRYLVEINGIVEGTFAKMSIYYPNGVVRTDDIDVTSQGVINAFIDLNRNTPSGLYKIVITSYTGDELSPSRRGSDTDYFIISDYDGLVQLNVIRGAWQNCKSDDIMISNNCMTPPITRIPMTFGLRIFNDDYRTHQFEIGRVTGNPILPDGDSVIFPESRGDQQIRCIIHPWLGANIEIVNVPEIQFNQNDIITNPNIRGTIGGNIDGTSGGKLDKPDPTVNLPPTTNNNNNNNVPTMIPYNYNLTDCTQCRVGTVSEHKDGDNIFVDGIEYRLAIVDVIGDGVAAANLVAKHCPVGLQVLVDVDDGYPKDPFGNLFIKLVCKEANINELLHGNGLVKTYGFACRSEFADESWMASICPDQQPKIIECDTELVDDKCIEPEIPVNATDILNNTISNLSNITNNTTVKKIQEDPVGLLTVGILFGVVLVIICLIVLIKKVKGSTKGSLLDEPMDVFADEDY